MDQIKRIVLQHLIHDLAGITAQCAPTKTKSMNRHEWTETATRETKNETYSPKYPNQKKENVNTYRSQLLTYALLYKFNNIHILVAECLVVRNNNKGTK